MTNQFSLAVPSFANFLYAMSTFGSHPSASNLFGQNIVHAVRQSNHSSIASASWASAGTLPSFSIFSRRMISSKVLAFLINSWTFFRSVSVSCTRMLFDVEAEAAPSAVVSKVRDFTPIIFEASAVGSAAVPNNSTAFLRSASLTFRKSRNRTRGHRQRTHSR